MDNILENLIIEDFPVKDIRKFKNWLSFYKDEILFGKSKDCKKEVLNENGEFNCVNY